MKKDLLSIGDLTQLDFMDIIDKAMSLKAEPLKYYGVFKGKTAVLIFDKPSLRTRVTFEVAMNHFGGSSLYIPGKDIALGQRESIPDGAKNLSRWVDVIIVRTFGQEIIEEFAVNASIPVINALTDLEHPCQALACMMTIKEHLGRLQGVKIVFIGDGNNVAHSIMLLSPLAGVDFSMCCPEEYAPCDAVESVARENARKYKTTYSLTHDPVEAVKNADIIYTDVWASMGQEDETDARAKVFMPYQVNEKLLSYTGDACLVSHCLPAHRGEEITTDVLGSSRCIAFDEAENRLHVQKAVLFKLLKRS